MRPCVWRRCKDAPLAELRWILLALNLLLLGGIWWWGVRQSRQAPGNAELRESAVGSAAARVPVRVPAPAGAVPAENEPIADSAPDAAPRDWGVPPFEPLSIRTDHSEHVPALDRPMSANADSVDLGRNFEATPAPPPPAPAPAPAPVPAPKGSELQRIVTIRVCAVGEGRWSGTDLMAALERLGLAYGRYQVYHRKHVDGRSMFCVASLVEPGTFDLTRMAEEQFRGVTLFAVLPGPVEPLQTIDALFATARGLAERLSGMVQDAKGIPFSPQRAAALREDVARFQALLPA